MSKAHEHNRRAWDERARQGKSHTRPAPDQAYENLASVTNPCGWLPDGVAGKRLLCLAAGGARHSVLYAAAGAVVTVVDFSPEMLALDRQQAEKRGVPVTVVEASMDDLSTLAAASFDIVIQPVSTCYVPDVVAVYREVARITAPGGLYISQHKQPASLQADAAPVAQGYVVNTPYYHAGPLAPLLRESEHREAGTIEFLHRWTELLGGLCHSGFVIEDVSEPHHENAKAAPGTFGHRSWFIPPYVAIKARRTSQPAPLRVVNQLWTPG